MALELDVDILIISAVFSAAALITVCLRFCARVQQRAKFSIDDFLIIPAALCAIGVGVANGISATKGHLGRHMQYGPDGPVTGEFLVIMEKCEFANELLSLISLAFTKTSIVFFYRRIFRGKVFSIITIVLIVLIAIWGIGCFFAQLFSCNPIAANWDVFGKYPDAKCFNPLPMYYGTASLDMIIDLMILIVPQPLVWKLHMPIKKKAAVSAVFLLGMFVIGISTARIAFFVDVGKKEGWDTDKTYFIAPAIYWTQLEVAIAVICACLPTLGIVFSGFSPERVLKSWASKLSLRSAHSRKAAAGDDNLPQWEDTASAKAGSASSILRNKSYTCEAMPLSSIDASHGHTVSNSNGITVRKAVLQERSSGEA